jgi:hypothetical protein
MTHLESFVALNPHMASLGAPATAQSFDRYWLRAMQVLTESLQMSLTSPSMLVTAAWVPTNGGALEQSAGAPSRVSPFFQWQK